MALVYYHRGLKRYPKSEEFKAGLAKAEKRSVKKGDCFIQSHFLRESYNYQPIT